MIYRRTLVNTCCLNKLPVICRPLWIMAFFCQLPKSFTAFFYVFGLVMVLIMLMSQSTIFQSCHQERANASRVLTSAQQSLQCLALERTLQGGGRFGTQDLLLWKVCFMARPWHYHTCMINLWNNLGEKKHNNYNCLHD